MIEVKLADGRLYKILPLDLGMIIEAEKYFGKRWDKLFDYCNPEVARYFCYVNLKRNHPEITLEQTGWLLNLDSMNELIEKVLENTGVGKWQTQRN